MADFTIELPEQGPRGPTGQPGIDGAPGEVGPRGPALGIGWDYEDYAGSGPGVGRMMLEAVPGPITSLLLDVRDHNGVSVQPWIEALGTSTNSANKGFMNVVQVDAENHWYIFEVTGLAVEYIPFKYRIPVNQVTSSGMPFEDGKHIAVTFSKSGNKGLDGAGGDMFGANNLSELANPLTSFNTIKQGATLTYPGVGLFLPNFLTGLNLSNAAIDLLHDISISPGMASDTTNVFQMWVAAALVKQLDFSWAVGTNAGGLDTGVIAANTWYHVYLIRRPDTGAIDACFSINNSAPTFGANIPVAYMHYRRIGSVRTDAVKNIYKFRQNGDRFEWDLFFSEFVGTIASGGTLITLDGVPKLPVPPFGIFILTILCDPQTTQTGVLCDPNGVYNNSNFNVYQGNTSPGAVYGSTECTVRVNSAGQVRAGVNASQYGRVECRGFIDNRGKG